MHIHVSGEKLFWQNAGALRASFRNTVYPVYSVAESCIYALFLYLSGTDGNGNRPAVLYLGVWTWKYTWEKEARGEKKTINVTRNADIGQKYENPVENYGTIVSTDGCIRYTINYKKGTIIGGTFLNVIMTGGIIKNAIVKGKICMLQSTSKRNRRLFNERCR